MRRELLFVAALNVLACAVQVPLSPESAANLKGRRLTTLVGRRPAFYVDVSDTYLSELERLFVRAVAGDGVIRHNHIPDPALFIARSLRDGLAQRYGVEPGSWAVSVAKDDPTEVAAADPTLDVVLQVWTETLGLEDVESDGPKYRVRYTVNMRVIDTKVVRPIDGKRGAVISEASCSPPSEAVPQPAGYPVLVANGALHLKEGFEAAGKFCANDLRTRALRTAP